MNGLHTPFLKFQHPFTCIVAAPTKAGKTTFVSKLINFADELIEPAPKNIIWCYSEWQPAYEKLPKVSFIQGLPELTTLRKCKRSPTLIVLDDLMSEIKRLKYY